MPPLVPSSPPASFGALLRAAIAQRQNLINAGTTEAFRVFSGIADGLDGVYLDVYDCGAVMIVYEGRPPRSFDPRAEAETAWNILKPLAVEAVYLKPFAKDRSRLGGALPACVTDPTPAAGGAQPEAIVIREHDWKLEIRLYDGLSTGLFLDQRDNRHWVAQWSAQRARAAQPGPAVLNTFAYTCAFSVAAAVAGASTTSVDVSARYLDWGKRNFAHNGLDPAEHHFAKMDTFDFFGYAARKALRYDLIILDPPSFAAGKKKVRPWSSVADYARLVGQASRLLKPRGVIFASTNTQELCRPGRLEHEIVKGLGRTPKWIELPETPVDFAREEDRFAARAFGI